MNDIPMRKSNRLAGYDYSSAGCYFVTICVKDKRELLWAPTPVGARIARPPLSKTGEIINSAIENIPRIYDHVKVDKYVIMPNHIHLILVIDSKNGRAVRAPTISTIINQTKGYVTKQIGYSIWQKLFHDHIIRNEVEYQKIWQYIDENPRTWTEDCYYGEVV